MALLALVALVALVAILFIFRARIINAVRARFAKPEKVVMSVESEIAQRGIEEGAAPSFAPGSRKEIGYRAFASLVERYGGDKSSVRAKGGVDGLTYDCFFEGGGHLIGIDFLGFESCSFPNSHHRTREEYRQHRDAIAAKAADSARVGVFHVQVPFGPNDENAISDAIHTSLLQYSSLIGEKP